MGESSLLPRIIRLTEKRKILTMMSRHQERWHKLLSTKTDLPLILMEEEVKTLAKTRARLKATTTQASIAILKSQVKSLARQLMGRKIRRISSNQTPKWLRKQVKTVFTSMGLKQLLLKWRLKSKTKLCSRFSQTARLLKVIVSVLISTMRTTKTIRMIMENNSNKNKSPLNKTWSQSSSEKWTYLP